MNYPYEFKLEDAERFARERGIPTKIHGHELIFARCPFCQGKTNPRNDREKFSINTETGQYHCFRASCKASGNMYTLASSFDFSLSKEIDAYLGRKKEFRSFKKPEKPIVPKSAAVEYLESRGISKAIAERYEITTCNGRDNILVFPFYDEKGNLVSVKYRKTDFDKEKDNAKEWFEKGCKPILFGMKQCESHMMLVLTEGQLDTLAVAESGIGFVVSVPTGANGFTWVPYCWNWVNQFERIVVFGDHEKGRITLLDEISRRFPLEIYHVREEDYKDCKDANEILLKYGKEQVRKCVNNAVPIPVEDVIELADVEDVDIFKIEKLPTGIRSLDRLLYGGIPFGGVILVSGKSGQGKSTLASQIIVNARENGYKCFAYSGELPNYLFKAWMDFQVAGRGHIFEYKDSAFGDTNYNVSKTNRHLISEWYRGNVFLFDNRKLDGQETQSLLKITERVIQQYGVKVILLDNLMTAMTMDRTKGADQYERQTDFVNKLRSMAVKYNVVILLVAHKRKNGLSVDENDEIAGSSNIANLAMLTITYGRDSEIGEDQRLLKVSKNRLFGRIETKGFLLNYDEKSKRIYGEGDDLDKEYSWNDMNGFVPVDATDVVFD